MEDLIGNYYKELFQSEGSNMQDILDCIEPCINQENNEDLTYSFSSEEVKETIFLCILIKARDLTV